MSAAHTPAPWVATFEQNTLRTSIDFPGSAEFTPTHICGITPEDDNGSAIRVAEANAKLIAAAPDMAKALQELLKDATYARPAVRAQIRAVLEKAGVQ